MAEYLREQVSVHPSMGPQDVMKFVFQASFGAEHLLKDFRAAEKYLAEEFQAVDCSDMAQEPLYENISDKVCRVNLRSWKRRGLPLEWLSHMFMDAATVASLNGLLVREEKRRLFAQGLEEAGSLVREGIFAFDTEEWEQFLENYPVDEPVAVHHSQLYRNVEKPAYRLVKRKFERLFPILEALVKHWGEGVKIVAIDGRCGSGKTTLAKLMAEILESGVVHMDDFFLPVELRTQERLAQPGGNVHYERFVEEILPKLDNREAFSYKRFDCRKMALAGERWVCPGELRIVEGGYSCHPKLGEYMMLKVFCDVEKEEQLARILDRDGEEALKQFEEKWIPMEEAYFAAFHIREHADVVI